MCMIRLADRRIDQRAPCLIGAVTLIGAAALAACGLAACGDEPADLEADAVLGVKAYVEAQLAVMETCAQSLADHAPAPDADGWSHAADTVAVDAMRADWRCLRTSYERIEAAIAVLFPQYDASLDERYDGFIADGADANLFDDTGVTGVHAVERILWASEHPPQVIEFEESLVGYSEARTPATEAEARSFRDVLVGLILSDLGAMMADFAPAALDAASAFRGVIASMAEQLEKTNFAASGEDESRYAQHTLGDMRANLAGGREIYAHFQPWLRSRDGGEALDASVLAGFDRVANMYDTLPGDALPPVPSTWNPRMPSAEDAATPYGMLHALLIEESDVRKDGSVVDQMSKAADLLGIPQLPE